MYYITIYHDEGESVTETFDTVWEAIESMCHMLTLGLHSSFVEWELCSNQ